MKPTYLVVILTSLLTFQACSYVLKTVELEDGRKIPARYYPDYEKEQDYKTKCVFKYEYKKMTYPKYSGNIQSDTISGLTFIQFDSIRVYLGGDAVHFKQVFTSGLLYYQIIYCNLPDPCPFRKDSWVDIEGKPLIRTFHGWTGPKIFIDDFEELTNANSTTHRRRFRFKISDPNGGASVHFLELTNRNKTLNFDDFVAGAETTFLKAGWGEI
jgi:hypothetical protein